MVARQGCEMTVRINLAFLADDPVETMTRLRELRAIALASQAVKGEIRALPALSAANALPSRTRRRVLAVKGAGSASGRSLMLKRGIAERGWKDDPKLPRQLRNAI
jgi:hypothetical protein